MLMDNQIHITDGLPLMSERYVYHSVTAPEDTPTSGVIATPSGGCSTG